MPTISLITPNMSDVADVEGGEFGENTTIVLDVDQQDVVLPILHAAAAWQRDAHWGKGLLAIVEWMQGWIEAKQSETSSAANALTELCHQFVWQFWKDAQQEDKRDFLRGLAHFLNRGISDKEIDRWIDEANSNIEILQRRTGANIADLQHEFWMDTYEMVLLDDYFNDSEQS